MSYRLLIPDAFFLELLERRLHRLFPDGSTLGDSLRYLLLGSHASSICGRRDEYALDGWFNIHHDYRETRPPERKILWTGRDDTDRCRLDHSRSLNLFGGNDMSTEFPPWHIKGELILNCNCTVFCPCVISLGAHYPTEGHCQAWLGVDIHEGRFDNEDLNGLKVAMLLDIPGRMS